LSCGLLEALNRCKKGDFVVKRNLPLYYIPAKSANCSEPSGNDRNAGYGAYPTLGEGEHRWAHTQLSEACKLEQVEPPVQGNTQAQAADKQVQVVPPPSAGDTPLDRIRHDPHTHVGLPL
jgi:hypothetical protein